MTKKKQRHTGLWFLVIILLFLLMCDKEVIEV